MSERRTTTPPRPMAADAVNQFLAEARAGNRDDRVRIGRLFTERKSGCQWGLGDLAIIEAGPARTTENHDGRGGVLGRFAEEIGENENDLQVYRAVATAWEIPTRVGIVPWTCFRQIYNHEPGNACRAQNCAVSHGTTNRDKTRQQVMQEFIAHCEHIQRRPSYRAMQEFLGIHVTPETTEANRFVEARRTLAEATPAERQNIINEAVRGDTAAATSAFQEIVRTQPDAVAAGIRDQSTHVAIIRADREYFDNVERQTRQRNDTDPTLRHLDQRDASLDLQDWIEQERVHLRRLREEIWPRIGEASTPLPEQIFLNALVIECQDELDRVRALVQTGRSDIDNFVSGVLNPHREQER